MRCLVAVCIVLALGSGGVQAQDISKHLDPPGPPRYDEFVYLYELTLLEDYDDWFNGETEIMIRTKITKAGHETGVWTMLVNDIDMDGDLSNEYTVLDGDELRAERKGSKANIYVHCECDPLVPMNLDIAVWEIDSVNASDVLEKLGEAAGQLTELGILSGALWIGDAAEVVGPLIDALGNDETLLGIGSGVVPDGLSAPSNPTTSYRYRTQYVTKVTDDQECTGTTRETGWERAGDPSLDDVAHDFYEYLGMGWDEHHPFTMCPSEAERRLALLQEVLDLADELVFESETHPGMEHLPGVYKGAALSIACNALEVEVNEALAADVIPSFVFEANLAIDEGRALARDGNFGLALTTCSEYIPDLLVLNHPKFFWDGFESSDTGVWSATVGGGIIIID